MIGFHPTQYKPPCKYPSQSFCANKQQLTMEYVKEFKYAAKVAEEEASTPDT
jgi:hypothetical protein